MASWLRTHLLAPLNGASRGPASPDEYLLDQACQMVDEGLETTLTRADAALHLGISEGSLARLFREGLGLSFRDYVPRVRMAYAQKALLDPTKSISDVGQEAGYAYTSAFTRAFVQTCGVSPREYRASPRSYPSIKIPSFETDGSG